MNHRKNLICSFVKVYSCVLMLMVGCSPTANTQSIRVDHSTPIALAKSFEKARRAKDDSALLECMAFEYRKKMSEFLQVTRRCERKAKEVTNAIRKKIGEKASVEFLAFCDKSVGVASPFGWHKTFSRHSTADPDWNLITFKTEGDTSYAILDSEHTSFYVEKIDGLWYINNLAFLPPNIPMLTGLYSGFYDELKKWHKQILSGTKGQKEFNDFMNEKMRGEK